MQLSSLKKFPYHFLLLLLFFLLHGYSEHVGLIPFIDLLVFFASGAAAGLLIFFLSKKILRSSTKAGILTTLTLLFYLFYGSIKDALKGGVLHQLSRYSILLPAMLVLLAAGVVYFKRTTKQFFRLTLFVNVLLLIYLLIDTGTIVVRATGTKAASVTAQDDFIKCDTCSKPDIHLIILDEYSGSDILQSYFNYNNEAFEEALRQRGFFVARNGSSNYSATPVSVASLFSMDYLPQFHRTINADDYTRAEQVINKSAVLQLVQAHGYRFMNHSIFNLAGQPGRFKTDLLPMRLKLITSKTMWNSLTADLGWHIHGQVAPKMNWLANILQDDYKDGNQRLLQLTQDAIGTKDSSPRFIYTHLLMPHWPYLYDSTGRETGINFYRKDIPRSQKESAYVQYLAYTNKLMLQLVDSIAKQSRGEAAIILMSDHGYREKPGKQTCVSVNNNFISVYLPGKNYGLFYDSMSNVNLFRSVFNTMFRQQFMPLHDSCIF